MCKEEEMNDNSASLLLTLLCCFGFAGALSVGGIILAVVLWPKNKAAFSAPNQIPPAPTSQAPPSVKPTVTPPPKPPPEAMEHFERAMAIEAREGDTSAWHEKASELALAIKKANGLYPTAHAMLGLALLMLGDENKARQELNLALQQNNNHVFARGMLILMDMDKLGIPNALRPTGSSLLFDLAGLGVGMVAAQGKVNAL
jgi:hypothetical protein